jgi:type IV secretory pathway VirB3-like protein
VVVVVVMVVVVVVVVVAMVVVVVVVVVFVFTVGIHITHEVKIEELKGDPQLSSATRRRARLPVRDVTLQQKVEA